MRRNVRRHNRSVSAWLCAVVMAGVALAAPAEAQTAPPAPAPTRVDRLLVLPFTVTVDGDVPGGEGAGFWLGEATALLVADDLEARGLAAVARPERVEAFGRLQLPLSAALTRATMIRVGELVGATDLVIGDVRLGRTLTISARRIRLDSAHERAQASAEGPATELYAVVTDLVGRLTSRPRGDAEPRMPIAAFEQYVKGLVASTPAVQERFLEAARGQAGADARVLLALWDLHTEQGAHDKALSAAAAVPRTSRFDRQAQYAAAWSLIELRRFDEAYARLQSLDAERASPWLSNALGVIQMRRGSTPQTGLPTFFFTRAADQAPDHPDFLFNLGYAYARSRDANAAIYWLREVVRYDPADGDAHLVMSQMLAAVDRRVEAQRELELARQLGTSVEIGPAMLTERVPAGLERLPTRLADQPVVRVASAIATPAQREQQELAAFHLGRGRRLFEQGDDRGAIAELRRVVYLQPYHDEAHRLLGQIYRRSGRLAEAVDAFRIAVWARETVEARLQLAETLSEQGNVTAAIAEVKRALQLDPASTAARDLLARLGGGQV